MRPATPPVAFAPPVVPAVAPPPMKGSDDVVQPLGADVSAPPPKKGNGCSKWVILPFSAVMVYLFVIANSKKSTSTPVAVPASVPESVSGQAAVAKAEARMAKAEAEQKVYFDAVKLAKLSKTDAVAMLKKDPRWTRVTVDKDSIVLKDAPAVAADGDGKNGYSPKGTHVSIDYDHGRLLSAWVTFQERPPDPYKLLAFVGLKGAPEPTGTDDLNRPGFSGDSRA